MTAQVSDNRNIFMDTQACLNLFFELVRIDSESGNEANIREHLINLMKPLVSGWETDSRGNIKFTVPGTLDTAPRLLSSHMDTVAPGCGIKPVLGADGVIRSNGDTILGADDKDGITAIICALRKVKKQNIPHAPLEILFTAGEEKSLSGSRYLEKDFITSPCAWVFDGPGAPGTIYCNGVGKKSFIIKVKGRAAHAGLAPEKGINAFMLAVQGLTAFPPGRRDNATVNYGTISGGKADNIVPEEVVLTGEIRSRDTALLEKLSRELFSAWQDFSEIEQLAGYPAYEETDEAFLNRTKNIFSSCGITPVVKDFSAGSDANHLARLGLKVCLLAMGRSDNHTKSESTRPEFISLMSDIAFKIMTCQENI